MLLSSHALLGRLLWYHFSFVFLLRYDPFATRNMLSSFSSLSYSSEIPFALSFPSTSLSTLPGLYFSFPFGAYARSITFFIGVHRKNEEITNFFLSLSFLSFGNGGSGDSSNFSSSEVVGWA